jgi:GntR family transcriptional repressor for pyruvate dehydrogenase complex
MPFKTIRKTSAPEMVADQILKKIDAGELAPGGRLPAQRELALQMGVGRSSLREATNALVAMGYLEVIQGKGTFVREAPPANGSGAVHLQEVLQAGSIFDLMEAREFLECTSARLAARRADAGSIELMAAAVEEIRGNRDDIEAFLTADLDFHLALAEATGNMVIAEMTKLVIDRVHRHHASFASTLLSDRTRENTFQSARKVVDQVRAGNETAAAGSMREHLRAVSAELKDRVYPGGDADRPDGGES